jgi:hypothetical protein
MCCPICSEMRRRSWEHSYIYKPPARRNLNGLAPRAALGRRYLVRLWHPLRRCERGWLRILNL